MEIPKSDPLLALLKAELEVGERLRWSGRPKVPRVNCAAFGIWLFAIPWTSFALFWMIMAWQGVSGDSEAGVMRYAFPAFGIPFVAIGLGMLLAPFMGMFATREVIHGVTDRRIITLIKGQALKVKTLQGRHIGPIRRWERKDGTGKLTIETHSSRDKDGDRRTETVDLIGIDNVKRVGELVRELSRSAGGDAELTGD